MNARKYLLFKLQAAIGSRIEKHYAELKRLERGKISELRDFQDSCLAELLSHAVTEVPFYRERVTLSRDLSLEQFPILTKADVTRHFAELMSKELSDQYHGKARKAGYSWIPVKTGGSTGMPTTVIHDASYRDKGRAARAYAQELCGFPLGTPYFRLWGSMRDINRMKDSLPHRVLSRLQGEIVLNAFRMGEEQILRYVKVINSTPVDHMMCYVDAGYQLARFIQSKNLTIKPLRSIMACAGTVTEESRRVLKDVFRSRVHNQYGSRECAGIACECEAGTIHTYGTNVIVESVDEHGAPVGAGGTGRFLITLLGNYSFPLIRYEIGDMGAIQNDDCACGRVFPGLARIEGRRVEFLMSTDGDYVTPVYIRHLIGVVHNDGLIRQFQLIQRSATNFQLRITSDCPEGECRFQDFVTNVERDLKVVLGRKANIQFIREKDLGPEPSGKFLYTVNLTNGQSS